MAQDQNPWNEVSSMPNDRIPNREPEVNAGANVPPHLPPVPVPIPAAQEPQACSGDPGAAPEPAPEPGTAPETPAASETGTAPGAPSAPETEPVPEPATEPPSPAQGSVPPAMPIPVPANAPTTPSAGQPTTAPLPESERGSGAGEGAGEGTGGPAGPNPTVQMPPAPTPQAPTVPPFEPQGATDSRTPSSPFSPGSGQVPTGSKKPIVAAVLAVLSIPFSSIPVIGLPAAIAALVLVHKMRKTGLRNTTLTVGKVCGIIGVVLSTILLVIWLTFGVIMSQLMPAIVGEAKLEETRKGFDDLSNDFDDDLDLPATSEDADEKSARSAADAELSLLAGKDPLYTSMIAEDLSSEIQVQLEMAPDELGVDPALYADWLLSDLTYKIDSVHTSEDEATVFATITAHGPYDFLERWSGLLDEAPNASSSEEGRAIMAQAYNQAMSETTDVHDTPVMLEFTKDGRKWVLDRESMDNAVWLALFF